MIKNPKYNFGLLQTPGSSSFNSGNEASTDSREESAERRRKMAPPHSSCQNSTSLSDFQRGSSSVSGSCGSRNFHTPRNPRTPYSRRTPYNTTSSATPADVTAVIVAIVEGRGLARGEIGMTSIDLKHPILTLSQFADGQTYAKVMARMNMLQPREIILPTTACEPGGCSKLFTLITNECPQAHVASVHRKYFNEEKGFQCIKQLCIPEFSTVEMQVKSKYYCLATAHALLKYVEFIQGTVFAPASVKVVFKGSEHTTMIDVATVRNLELLRNCRDPHSEHTLFGILNHNKTPMGMRLLRANILQPPCDVQTITMRLNVVSELTENEEMFLRLREALGHFTDLNQLLASCIQIPKQETVKTADSMMTTIVCLKHTLEEVVNLRAAIVDSNNELLKSYAQMLSDDGFRLMHEKIQLVIHNDTHYHKGTLAMKTQKCYAVKSKISGLLDVARRTYSEIIDDMNQLVKQMGNVHSLPLKISYNCTRGFHLQLCQPGKHDVTDLDLPDVFIKVTRNKNLLSFTTAELIKLNERVKESLNEIYMMSSQVVSGLMNDIRVHMGCLYKLTECVAMLDMLSSFAFRCSIAQYVRPEFTDTLAIRLGRHPILDKIAVETPIANSTYASDESNFIILTGPNMSGKSTYLRQIALLQIMAQIGSYVPADVASFRIVDQIFSRIANDNDLETNCSTFTLEMCEINYILQNATNSSLIIIDELGRGTDVDEGIAISHAICEHLRSLKAITFFVTHFMQLTNLDSLYANIENYHFEVQHLYNEEIKRDQIVYTHVMSRGKTKERHYGLHLSEVSVLPKTVVEDAKLLCQKISDQEKQRHEMSAETRHQRAVFKLAKRLEQVANSSRLDPESLQSFLKSLKEHGIKDMDVSLLEE